MHIHTCTQCDSSKMHCSTYTHTLTFTCTHTHTPHLADGVWLVEDDEAYLVAFVGTSIIGVDVQRGVMGTRGAIGGEGMKEKHPSIAHRERRTWSQDTCQRAMDGHIKFT